MVARPGCTILQNVSPVAAALLEHAMTLSAPERLRLGSALLDSVEGPANAEWEDAWRKEIDERLREAEEGGAADEPWTRVREELRARLR